MTEKQQSVTTESVTTVIVAGGANLAIAIAKVIAGVISGSASMLSEAAHSFADRTTEVLLYVALRRSTKPADKRHPFGYGRAGLRLGADRRCVHSGRWSGLVLVGR